MKDEQYNEFIKEKLNNEENNYFADIEHDKNAVWNRIENRLEAKKVIPLWLYTAAASAFIIIGTVYLFKLKLENKDFEIAQLKQKYEKEVSCQNQGEPTKTVNKDIDTVIIYAEKPVITSISQRDTIVVYDTITNIIVKTDTVYVNQNIPEIALNENIQNRQEVSDNQAKNSQLVTKNKTKRRRLIFHLGKSKLDNPDPEPKGFITLQTK